MPSTAARQRWFPIVRELEASGLTTAAFAMRHGLNKNTLAWWRSLVRRDHREAFIEVVVQETRPEREVDQISVWLQGGRVQVVVDKQTDLDLLRVTVAALC